MSVRTFVGFVADFPTENNDFAAPGKELAAFVSKGLKDAGFTVDEPCDNGWAWDFSTKDGKLEIMSIVALVDDKDSIPPRQWLITNYCELGFFQRLFGAKTLAETREHFLRKFCDNLHQIISADSRFSHIVWYDEETFDKPNDQLGATP